MSLTYFIYFLSLYFSLNFLAPCDELNLWPKFTIVNLLPYLDILKEQGKFLNDITSYRLITDIERYDNSKELNQSEIQYNYCIKNNSEYDGGYDIKVNIMRINYNLITSIQI